MNVIEIENVTKTFGDVRAGGRFSHHGISIGKNDPGSPGNLDGQGF